MVDQAAVSEHDGKAEAPAATMMRNLGDCARDVIDLAELQARLLALDLKQSARRTAMMVGVGLVAVAFLLAGFPLLLTSIAILLAEAGGLSYWAAFFIATGIGFLAAAILGAVAWAIFRHIRWLERSRSELVQNLRWLKDLLSASGRSRHRSRGE